LRRVDWYTWCLQIIRLWKSRIFRPIPLCLKPFSLIFDPKIQAKNETKYIFVISSPRPIDWYTWFPFLISNSEFENFWLFEFGRTYRIPYLEGLRFWLGGVIRPCWFIIWSQKKKKEKLRGGHFLGSLGVIFGSFWKKTIPKWSPLYCASNGRGSFFSSNEWVHRFSSIP